MNPYDKNNKEPSRRREGLRASLSVVVSSSLFLYTVNLQSVEGGREGGGGGGGSR